MRSIQDLVGEVVGNYRVESLIDEGGMGRVYRARHIHLNRPAAIKIMLPELEVIPGYRARFLQEARAAAALRHPNIVEIYECGEQGGRFYLAMELVPDGSLLNLMRGQKRRQDQPPFSMALGLELARQAAVGLDYAHKLGMVHRDVKPANLLLEAKRQPETTDESYTLKLTDFGLARLKEGGVETTIGKVRGTLAYMSPEQCQGFELDGRSDLYALGIILFELATGRRPFSVKSPADALFQQVYTQPPSPRSIRPEIPAELEEIILRCLAKDPKARYASCASLAADLESLVRRGVLIGDVTQEATRLEEQPDVSTALLAIPLGISTAPPEVVDGQGEQAQGKIGSGETPGSSPVAKLKLPRVRVFDQEGETVRLVDLTGDGLTIGRLSDNDLALQVEGVSRHHLRIEWDGSQASVTDLGSRNGTFLKDGTQLIPGEGHPWPPLESLRLGNYWIRLESEAPIAATAEAPTSTVAATVVRPIAEPTVRGVTVETAKEEITSTAPVTTPVAETAGLVTAAAEVAELETTTGLANAPAVGPIVLSLEPVQLKLSLGMPSRLLVKLRNDGDTSEQLGVLVEGVPQDWVTTSGEGVALQPGEEGAITLSVFVPQDPSSRAGDYPVVVHATRKRVVKVGETGGMVAASPAAAVEAVVAEGAAAEGSVAEKAVVQGAVADECEKLPFTASGRWTVHAITKHSIALLPERLRALRVAEYQVKLENDGNSQSTLELSATEPELSAESSEAGEGKANGKAETLIYEFSQPKVSLEPGQTTEVTLKVTAPARLVGPEQTYPFEVSARPGEAGEPLTAKAEFVRRALVPLWATITSAAVVGLAVLAALSFSLSPDVRSWILGTPREITPTAIAQVGLPSPTSLPLAVATETSTATPTAEAAPTPGPTTIAGPDEVVTPVETPTSTPSAEPDTPTPTPTELPTQTPTPTKTPPPTRTPTNTPCPAPAIALVSDRPEIVKSQSAKLSWNVSGASKVSIDNGIGTVSASDSKTVSPASTTTYNLTATYCGGKSTKKDSVTVTVLPPPSLTFTPPSPIKIGQSATLKWNVTGADSTSIDNGIGAVAASSTKAVSPTSTTTYTLTASKLGYTATAKATVTVYTKATVTVTFTKVTIHDDADPSAAGEIWLDFRVNTRPARWPGSGTRSLNNGATVSFAPVIAFTFTLYPSDGLSIWVNGTDEDNPTWGDPNDPLGVVSKTYTSAADWGQGEHADRSTCPDGCYTIYYTVSTQWKE